MAKPLAEDHWRIRLHISYDGTDFFGWQRQSHGCISVQETLETAVSKLFNMPVTVIGASRTDTGVHAIQQVVHFDIPKDPTRYNLHYALQCLTPPSIVIKEAFLASGDFHSIASVEKKTYKYLVLNRQVPSALRNRYTTWIRSPLSLDFLNDASQILVKKQDFKSFQSAGTEVTTTVREVFDASWRQLGHDTLEFSITGDGFLKQMVRNIVGTLIELNQRGEPANRVQEILDARDRRVAGTTAAPQGLYLYRVYYPEELDKKCRKL